LLQLQLHDPSLLVQGIHLHKLGLLGCFNCQGLHDTQKFTRDSGIDTGTAEAHASGRYVKSITSINGLRDASSIGHRQATPAARTCKQASEQRSSTTTRFYVARLAVGIGR